MTMSNSRRRSNKRYRRSSCWRIHAHMVLVRGNGFYHQVVPIWRDLALQNTLGRARDILNGASKYAIQRMVPNPLKQEIRENARSSEDGLSE